MCGRAMLMVVALGVAWPRAVPADELTLVNGQVVTGQFAGFRNHRFVFQESGGAERQDFAAGVRSLRVDPPVKVSAQLMRQSMDDALFTGYEKFNVRLIKDGREYTEPATMLKRLDLAFDAGRMVESPGLPAVPPPAESPVEFDVHRTVEGPGVFVISRGEAVDIEKALVRGRVNVVFFHFPQAHSSVRQGNYVEMLAREDMGRTVVLKLIIPRWQAPVCESLDLKSLPQFWFYSPSGRLLRKLTDRFTESDIDEAFKEARRSP